MISANLRPREKRAPPTMSDFPAPVFAPFFRALALEALSHSLREDLEHAVAPPLLSRLCPQGLEQRQIREVEPDSRKKCPAFRVDVQGEAPVPLCVPLPQLPVPGLTGSCYSKFHKAETRTETDKSLMD